MAENGGTIQEKIDALALEQRDILVLLRQMTDGVVQMRQQMTAQGEVLADHGKTLKSLKWEQEQILGTLQQTNERLQQTNERLEGVEGEVQMLRGTIVRLDGQSIEHVGLVQTVRDLSRRVKVLEESK